MSEAVDYFLTNAIVLTMDEQFTQYEHGCVAVKDDCIVAVGEESSLQDRFTARQVVDCKGKVLMPGLINAHTHAPMVLLRGLADDLRLDVWLLGYMMPVEREFVSPDFVRLGTKLACAEMIRSGVTCFADMYYFEQYIAEATAEAGLRAVCGQTVLKFPAPDAAYYEESLAAARQFIQDWKGHMLIVPSVAPHAPYTCPPEILRACSALAVEFDVPLHIHLSETAPEVENMRNENGMPVVPYVKKQRIFEAKVLAAHCVHIDDGEVKTLSNHKVGVAHNPSSNLKLASGFAPVNKMLNAGLNVGIGTDGAASNNDLDMFEEIRLAAFVGKVHSNDPTVLPAHTVLSMATRLGAKALHIGHLTGTLEVGKRADLILVEHNRLHNVPRFRRDHKNIYAQIVYAGKASDVSDVMVNGQWLMRDRELLTLDETSLLEQAARYSERIDAFLLEREQSVLSKLIAIGGATEEESFEIQMKVRLTDRPRALEAISKPQIEVLHHRHYHEFDTYFTFDDPAQGRIRYREDELYDENQKVQSVRYRLTHLGQERERSFPSDVLLSRSRFLAPAVHSLRFYREYFKPAQETTLEKERLRWRVLFQGTEFFINIDHITSPQLGSFLEVKSRTWSRLDAEHKSHMAVDLIRYLGADPEYVVVQDYLSIQPEGQGSQP